MGSECSLLIKDMESTTKHFHIKKIYIQEVFSSQPWWHLPPSNLSYSGGKNRKFLVQDLPQQNHETLSEKQIKNKRTGSMAPVVERL
jgi:hypothetical protein